LHIAAIYFNNLNYVNLLSLLKIVVFASLLLSLIELLHLKILLQKRFINVRLLFGGTVFDIVKGLFILGLAAVLLCPFNVSIIEHRVCWII
jgi:hypothetical protein